MGRLQLSRSKLLVTSLLEQLNRILVLNLSRYNTLNIYDASRANGICKTYDTSSTYMTLYDTSKVYTSHANAMMPQATSLVIKTQGMMEILLSTSIQLRVETRLNKHAKLLLHGPWSAPGLAVNTHAQIIVQYTGNRGSVV